MLSWVNGFSLLVRQATNLAPGEQEGGFPGLLYYATSTAVPPVGAHVTVESFRYEVVALDFDFDEGQLREVIVFVKSVLSATLN
jgi:hypothetical protein